MASNDEPNVYLMLGELIAEVRGLHAAITSSQNSSIERFTRIEDRVGVVEQKVDGFEGIIDRVRGATTMAKAVYLLGGAVGGGGVMAVAELLSR